jgi:hypothetical protein
MSEISPHAKPLHERERLNSSITIEYATLPVINPPSDSGMMTSLARRRYVFGKKQNGHP